MPRKRDEMTKLLFFTVYMYYKARVDTDVSS